MQITDAAWVQLTTGTGALVQKSGSGFLTLVYATTTPTTEAAFALTGHDALSMPAVAGKNLYARSTKGNVNLSVEVL